MAKKLALPRWRKIGVTETEAFWHDGTRDDVYRAPINSGMDTLDAPMGKRWECSMTQFRRCRDSVFHYVKAI